MRSKLVLVATVAVALLSPAVALAVCGDNVVDLGEECDVGGGGGVCCIGCMFQPSTTECRPAAGECDLADFCTGSSDACPADLKSTAECRPAFGAVASSARSDNGTAGVNDTIATMSGDFEFQVGAGPVQTVPVTTSTTLQQLVDAINGLAAGATASVLSVGTFKLLLMSDEPGAASNLTIVTDDTTLSVMVTQVGLDPPCDTAELCDGVGNTCPADVFEPAATVCRPAAGSCDVAESCPGTAPHICPPDTLVAPATECRPSAGACDLAESCTGTGPICPLDAKSTAVCRASAGGCDPAESCDGVGDDCPGDVISPAATVCRMTAGDCDIAETCDGASPSCPADGFVAAGVECRAAAGQCDVAESCPGGAAACPPDGFKPNGTPCDDSMACTVNDMCVSGMCEADPMNCGDGTLQEVCGEECDDGNTTAGDGCSATCQAEAGLGCPATPLVGCRQPVASGKAKIQIRDQEKIGGLKFKWQWIKGALTDVSELGDPLTDAPAGTSYTLCVYDASGLLTQSTAPAGGLCHVKRPRPCWKARGSRGFTYKDPPQSIEPFGLKKVDLRAGRDGKAKVQVQGTGGLFELPSNGGFSIPDLTAIASPLTVQVQNTTGLCFEAIYSAPFDRQEAGRFQAKAD